MLTNEKKGAFKPRPVVEGPPTPFCRTLGFLMDSKGFWTGKRARRTNYKASGCLVTVPRNVTTQPWRGNVGAPANPSSFPPPRTLGAP